MSRYQNYLSNLELKIYKKEITFYRIEIKASCILLNSEKSVCKYAIYIFIQHRNHNVCKWTSCIMIFAVGAIRVHKGCIAGYSLCSLFKILCCFSRWATFLSRVYFKTNSSLVYKSLLSFVYSTYILTNNILYETIKYTFANKMLIRQLITDQISQ